MLYAQKFLMCCSDEMCEQENVMPKSDDVIWSLGGKVTREKSCFRHSCSTAQKHTVTGFGTPELQTIKFSKQN